MSNLFRQAKELLDTKRGSELTEQELDLVSQAIAPLLILPAFSDITISEGLEELAKILEEARK